MRRGKECAQSSHASMAFLTKCLKTSSTSFCSIILKKPEIEWLRSSFAKVTLQVNSEEELLEIHEKAKAAGLTSHLVTDAGRTEFNGQPTHTACAIGPDYCDKIDKITGELKLY